MKFFQDFRHDVQQNVIKRTPPPRLIKVITNVWRSEDEYANIFKSDLNPFIGPGNGAASLEMERSSIFPQFHLVLHGKSNDTEDHSGTHALKFKYNLPFRKIDPRIIASALATAPKVNKKVLVNLINHLNFTNEQVSIHIQDRKTGEEFLQQGEPGPYLNDNVTIRFVDPFTFNADAYALLNLIIDNRKSLIVVPINLQSVCRESIVLRLPDLAHSYSKRQAVRHTCEGVDAEIVQGQFNMSGILEDINPLDLRVCVRNPENINPDNPLFLKLSQNDQTYFMGECRMVRGDYESSYVILQPIHSNRPVLSSRKYPNDRVRIMPPPTIHFVHPLCGFAVQCKVDDISASGFSVTGPNSEALLFPGMIIPQKSLQLPGTINSLSCTAQVVYRREQKKNAARYGFYILDMSLHDQRRLFDAVSKVIDPHVNMTGRVNMDSLWELFFDSGFIYPDKYGIISPYTAMLKRTYRKLYEEGQDIFTHLTYQDQGQVYGHMSMVKAYEYSWIIHHLAARPMRGVRTGLQTLKHFVNYIDCLYNLPVPSKTMRYNFCYYRPENTFSDYYFGGIYRTVKRRKICSMDLFGYMPMSVEGGEINFPDGWSLCIFSREDFNLMREYYNGIGGGLMLDGFALECRAAENDVDDASGTPGYAGRHNISAMYNKIGLTRDSKVYSIRHQGIIKAALIVDTSDLGINMSELLNSIKIIVIDNTLPWAILKDAVSSMGKIYGSDVIMVLIYPFEYLGQQGVECKKRYNFWVLSTTLNQKDKDIIKGHIKIAKRKFITEKFIKELAVNRVKKLLALIEKAKVRRKEL